MKTKLKILHLEDTPTDAELVERELKKGNIQFETLVVANKTAFEQALKAFAPDIIISDHTLPSFDSLEAIKMIKRQGLKIPIILVTATVSDEHAVEIMKAGADDYILKDRLHRLPQAVLNAMEKFSMEQERERMIYDQAHLAAIVNASNDGIISKTLDGIITSWNTGAEELLGYSAAETIGKNIAIIIPPDCLPVEAEFMESLKRGESVQHFETVRLTKNGVRVDVSLTISPIKDHNGKVIGAAKIVYDITDRKKAEQIIYDSEEKYHSLFENSLDAILLTVTDGKILAANPAACTMFGMSEKEICEAGRFGLVDTKDPRLAAALEERQRTGAVKAEVTTIRKNGETFPGEFTSVVYKNANGEERTSMIVRDLSERKRAEEEITKLSLVARKTSNAVVITDAKGEIQWVNDAFTRMTEFELNEIIGEKPGSFLQGPETDPVVVDYMHNKILNRQAFNCEIINYTKTGNKYWTRIQCQPEFESTGKLDGFFSIQTDITKEKEAEQAIAKLNERMALATTSVKMGIWEWDVVNNHFIWDKIMYQIFGVAEDEFCSANEAWEAMIHPDDIVEENEKVQIALSGDAKFDSEFRIVWPDKSIRYIKGDAIVEKDDNGKPLRMIGTNFDVTERKSLEKAVETERDQFFEMFSKAPSAIGMLKGPNHVFEMANPLYLHLTGKKDIVGKTVAEVLPEVIEQGFVSMLDHVYQTGESYTGNEMLVKVDTEGNGVMTDFYIDFVYQAYKNGKGDIEGVFFFINDITEQILSRKETEKSEKQYRQIVETAQEGIWLIDEHSRTTFVNKKMCEILEYTEEELIGKEHSFYMDADGKEKAVLALERRKRGISENLEFNFISKHGKHVLTKVSANPIFDDLGNFKGSLGMVSDITEKKHLEDLLEKSNRLAAVGSWEIDVVTETVYWSDITKEIREVDKDYVPLLGEGISYFKEGIHRVTIEQKVKDCIKHGTPWDEELQIITFKGNEKWVRTIGQADFLDGKCIKIHGSFQDITERKNAGIKVRDSEFRYRQIVETAQEGIWMLDENSETTFVNQKMCEIIGYPRDEMLGKTNFFFKDEADLQTANVALKRRKRGISETYKASFLTKDGRLIWTQISSNPIFDDANIYKGSLWMVSDITEKLMADKMLMESEQKHRKLASELEIERIRLVTAQSVAKVGSWETNLQTFQVNWSNETHRIFGSNPEKFEASHSAFLNFIHPEDREKVDAAFADSLHKSGSSTIEHRIITVQGIEKWVEEIWSVSRDEKGSPKIATGTCQDITASKKAADKVIRSEAKLNVAQYIAHVGSYEVDMVTDEQSWSDEFYRILGINSGVPPSREAFLSFVHPDDRPKVVSSMDEAYSLYEDSLIQFRFIRKNGAKGYASSEWKFEFDDQGNPLYLYGILRDLTKEKKAERERVKMISDIVQRNSDLEQFSYMVSHNLRAPTANIIGFADILQDDSISSQEQKELLQGLSASVKGLDTIIKDINIILQVEREVHEKKEVIIFSKLVNDIMLSIGNLIYKHRVIINRDFSAVDEIYSLKVYIYSIFYNLISNSIKYSKPNEQPRIEIKSKKENGKIILTFKDNGLGIDLKTKADKIFGLYNRFHSHVEGKGMGLFMVKKQVESLGGKITVASEPNQGTEFTIEFEI
ncbi:PAS domain S-box protein [Subsaximicrobium wynnwilliamsii]|uniref:PAS domain S-box protein n=1 Tax=Subsaximicrobium wynnwilliamsii TaxID=291179 RepID=UPI001676896A|nr:PAS domain S-box protein [Subsaximicrobium wynnwilliamsii]